MRGAARLGVFATALCAAFGAAFAAGAVVDPVSSEEPAADPAHDAMRPGGIRPGAAKAATEWGQAGVSASDSGYSLQLPDATLPAGRQVLVSFRIAGPEGAPVQQYRLTHDKEMHVILVRRDLSSFQHLHPTRDPGGTWTTVAELSSAGTYRMVADFAAAAVTDRNLALATDVSVPGAFEPAELPAPAPVSVVDGYEVALAAAPRAGEEANLSFTVNRGGVPVTDLDPYLAAGGHLVALRSADLAYLHTHPVDGPDAPNTSGPTLNFGTTFPIPGAYRLFLNFTHAGQVRTASFTLDVAGAPSVAAPDARPAPAAEPIPPAEAGSGGHGGHG